jgi:Trehalose utilisation
MKKHLLFWFGLIMSALIGSLAAPAVAQQQWVTFEGAEGPGKGRHIVLVSGDEEYRSEEALPQLAKILARRQGFKTTVLFAIDSGDGSINPNVRDNIPGLEALDKADLLILFTRFRELPDEQMKHVVDYVERGGPIVALRTSTHAFDNKKSEKYARYAWQNPEWDGGFGRQVLGETWINHHGQHGKQSTRGLIAPGAQDSPILRGIKDGDIWGPTDVYGVRLPLPGDSRPLVLGQVLAGMKPDDPPVDGKQNDPMMPIAWTKTFTPASGKTSRVFTTTMGASQDLASEGLRRLLVNACLWAIGLEDQITTKTNVELVGDYRPHPFGFGTFQKGVKPAAHEGD